jgi:hypothetical protein
MTIKCDPQTHNPTHHIKLIGRNGEEWGFILKGGARGLQDHSQVASNLRFTGGGTKFGDFEPGMSHIEQRTCEGGRGSDDFSLDPTRFWDSQNLFTMISGKTFNGLQWRIPTGITEDYRYLPQDGSDFSWKQLTGSTLYISDDFTVGASNLSADNVYLWLRRKGNPGTGTVKIYTDTSGSPNAAFTDAAATFTTTDITDTISEWKVFDLSAAGDLTAATKYHVVVYGATTDTIDNCWEIGVDTGTSGSKYSSAGSSWTSGTFSMFFRVTDTDKDRELIPFELQGMLCWVDKLASGGASTLYLNGDTGEATAGTSTTLVDTNDGMEDSWADDQWNGYRIRIVAGTGKGQDRLISDTTAAGTITVSSAWDITPSTDSVYVIYAGDAYYSIASGTTGLGAVKDVAVMENTAYFAQGGADLIRSMYINWAASPPAPVYYDDTTQYADGLHVFHNPVDGPQMWRFENNDVDVSRSPVVAQGADFTFGTEIAIGDDNFDILNLIDYDKQVVVFKKDGLYSISNDRANRLNVGLDFIKTDNNGQAAISHKEFLFFSWANFSLQRRYGSTVDSVGFDKDRGLPSGRKGKVAWLGSHPVGLFVCVDAGEGTSSVLFRDDVNQAWHEIFRAPGAGQRIRSMYWQDCPGTRPRLWIECNGELYYMEWPQDTLNPLEDSDVNYIHESVLELADIDMGVARLPKFIKELTCLTENLESGIEIRCDVQYDDADNQYIDTTTWVPMATFLQSPAYTVPIGLGEIYKIRVRLRLITDTPATPAILNASVLEGYAITPIKRQWVCRFITKSTQRTLDGRKQDHKPEDLLKWLHEAASKAKQVRMRTIWPEMDDVFVKVEPFSYFREIANTIRRIYGGTIQITLREA